MGKSRVKISTTLGRTLLGSDEKVYVRATPDSFLVKAATDVNPGDQILYEKPFTETTLDDVSPHLPKSPRYRKARDLIHEENSHGDNIPRLRTLLARGLAEKGVISSSNLEEKVLLEGDNDFKNSEYDAMTRYVSGILEQNESTQRSEATINNWLTGETLAPKDWKIFEVLGNQINPEFRKFKHGEEDPSSMYFNYRLYVSIRQGIMRKLKYFKGECGDGETDKPQDKHISLSPEFQIVFNHFIGDVNMDYATAKVTDINRNYKGSEARKMEREFPHIKEGILKHGPEVKMTERCCAEVVEDREVLKGYLAALVEDFDCGELDFGDQSHLRPLLSIPELDGRISEDMIDILEGRPTAPRRVTRHNMAATIPPGVIRHFGEDLNQYMAFIEKQRKETGGVTQDMKIIPSGDAFLNRFIDGALLGDVDSQLGLDRGTAMRLLETCFRIDTAIPRGLSEKILECLKLKPQLIVGGESYEQDLKKAESVNKKIKERYGVNIDPMGGVSDGGVFFSQYATMDRMETFVQSPREFIDSIPRDGETFASLIAFAEKELTDSDHSLYTRESVRKVLAAHRLEELLDLRKQGFYWEGFDIL